MPLGVIASGSGSTQFVDLDVPAWAWLATLALIVGLLLFEILVLNRQAYAPTFRRAALETAGRVARGAIEAAGWVAGGATLGLVIIASFGTPAGGEWFSGYLIECRHSIDNVFV